MTKSILKLATIVLSTSILVSCNTPEQKVENAQENVADANAELDKANEEYIADVASYRVETQQKIDDNIKSINEFKERMASEKREVRADYNKKITELESKNTDAKKRMDEYREEGKEKWELFKIEFNNDMKQLGQSIKDLTSNNSK